jgi:TolA-binding protein
LDDLLATQAPSPAKTALSTADLPAALDSQKELLHKNANGDKRRSTADTLPLPDVEENQAEKPSWQKQLHRGEWAEVLAIVGNADLPHLIAEADDTELWRLANWARHKRRTHLANQLFKAVRKRRPGSKRAAIAAFILGKSALDLNADPRRARKWLTTYLKEAPAGSLAEEALGGLISASEQLGDYRRAKKAARRYLDHYPGGTFSSAAKMVLER